MSKELPDSYKKFYEEYEELCKKHGLMVLSDGEEVSISSYSSGLWGVKESTIDEANSEFSNGYGEPNFLPSWRVALEVSGKPTFPRYLTVVAKNEEEAVEVAKDLWIEWKKEFTIEKSEMKLKEVKPES